MTQPADPGGDAGRPNTLGMSELKLRGVLDILERGQAAGPGCGRIFSRIPFRVPAVEVLIGHPGGGSVSLRLACRNLSRGGIGVLHNAYVHIGSSCTVVLTRLDGNRTKVRGTITRCQHRAGVIHEIGIRFDQEINPREYIRSDPLETLYTIERVDPAKLRGVLLYIGGPPMDQKILRHYLRSTQMPLRWVETGAEAVTAAQTGGDILLTELDLPDMDAGELKTKLRELGIQTPVIITAGDLDEAGRCRVIEARADAFLPKPYAPATVLCAMAEFLLSRTEEKPSPRKPAPDAGARFSQRAADFADRIEKLYRANQKLDVYTACAELGSEAVSVGYSAIGDLSEQIARRIGGGAELRDMAGDLSKLVRSCRGLQKAA